jgi:hypothetical protein
LQSFSEDVAQESRIAGLSDDVLFTLDTSGAGSGAKQAGKRSKRRRDASSEAASKNDVSKVRLFKLPSKPDPVMSSSLKQRVNKAVARNERREKKRASDTAASKRAKTSSKRVVSTGAASMMASVETIEPERDLWAASTTAAKPVILRGEELPDGYVRPRSDPKVAEAARRKPRTVPKGKSVKAVAVPAPGLSYMPEFEAHQDVIGSLVARETTRQRQIAKAAALWAHDPEYPRTLDVLAEYSDEEEDDGGMERAAGPDGAVRNGRVRMSANPPVANRRKTTVQRNRLARLQAEAEVRARAKQLADVERLAGSHKSLGRQARAEAAAAEQRRLERKAGRAARDDAAEPTVLKGGKAVDDERAVLEAPLTAELPTTLRQLKPSSARHPIQERFHGLLLQDKVEIGMRRQGKRTGRKKVIGRNKVDPRD